MATVATSEPWDWLNNGGGFEPLRQTTIYISITQKNALNVNGITVN
jgi:hypothetical protein